MKNCFKFNKFSVFLIIYFCSILFFASSCTTLKPKSTPESINFIPPSYSTGVTSNNSSHDVAWWQSFQSDELNSLISATLSNNLSIDQAWARLKQSKELAAKRGAAIYPNLEINLNVSEQDPLPLVYDSNNWSSGIASNYELDLWGRINAIKSSAKLDAVTAKQAAETLMVTLSAEVALKWNEVIAKRLELAVLQEQILSNKTMLELIELRFNNSLASALDVFQQKQIVESSQALMPILERQEKLALLELSTLLGSTKLPEINTQNIVKLSPLPKLGLPIDLISNRPDIKAAESSLKASDWLVAAARADQLPAIRISSKLSSTGESSSELFDNWITTFLGGLTMPFFDSGQRKAEKNRSIALSEERLGFYKETILRAFQEVETSITLEETQKKYIDSLEEQLEAAENSYNEAISRYQNGALEYTTVLLQLNSFHQLQRSMIQAKEKEIAYRIALHRALGGKWVEKLIKGD